VRLSVLALPLLLVSFDFLFNDYLLLDIVLVLSVVYFHAVPLALVLENLGVDFLIKRVAFLLAQASKFF
jgi:hypothetical protein